MTAYQVRFEKRAQKALKKMDKYQAGIIMAWIKKNLEGTAEPGVHGKGLTANRSGEWRYRVGEYRIIAHIDDEAITILILEVGHRRDIYERGKP
ncbi:type II toxin-antitoxin system RelE family toxin [Salibacterium halotolerans]|uniref:mRNA interferase RelE/StbE n=1 Tax=Salibacterium halotolerans TaxID=1884432 RepID=A0A1I5SDA8_9BACI|nr:type II toxin-antitoxin system RelE/ParE family toxin [Salibacterium halotolerans]SFP68748.1 mRNA interferase RelE/StbE [Salibacterium halotolerans]